MAVSKVIPARIHFIVAREAPVAIVYRRGPSKQVATLLWNLETDELTMGQWLKGRIYEMRGDISPDGNHLIYFATNGTKSWTAVSKSPFLKAIAFYPKCDCWFGGGLWTSNQTYTVNGGGTPERTSMEVREDTHFSQGVLYGGECPNVYFARLQRDGWQRLGSSKLGSHHDLFSFERPAPHGWLLRKVFHCQIYANPGKGCYWEEHILFQSDSKEPIALPKWRNADVWRDEVLWTAEGALFRGQLGPTGIEAERLVADLNSMRFEAIAAPY